MRNTITIRDTAGAVETGSNVDIYAYNASDTAEAAPNGAKIGDATEFTGTGQYYYDVAGDSVKVTVVVGGVCYGAGIGVEFDGETARDDSVNESAIADSSVTPTKTTFTRDY